MGALVRAGPFDAHIDPEQRHKIYEANARRVYPRLDAALKAKGR